jgi:ankyrin repeat protein
MVKLLLAKGADINAGTMMPALHAAVMKGPKGIVKDIVELLIQRGADINARDKWGYTPLSWAINNMYSSTNSDNLYIDVLNLLIANSANVNIRFPGGGTALLQAAKAGKIKAVQSLLEAGADISAKYNNSGYTALHIAAQNGHKNVVELLLNEGADINAKDVQNGYTALHHAARFGKANVVELLIAKGADINAKDKQGHTPLYVAVSRDYKVAELLIEKGADSTIKTESGKTLLQLAQERKQLESTAPDMIFDGEPNSFFGSPIVCGDIDGDGYDDIIIGASGYSNYKGRVYLFYGGLNIDTTPELIFEGEQEGDRFGRSIVCGDIDNDGYDDILIAADGYSDEQGRAYLYWGSDRNSMDINPDKIFTGEKEKGSFFGAGHPAIYDIDNDGYDDIILGAMLSSDRTGRAYLYFGNTKELMDTSHDLIFNGEEPEDRFGITISCGDVDNDGFGDIVIGTNKSKDRAYLYYGSSKSNVDEKADVIFEVRSEGKDHFGQSIACVDQNRDGYDDILIGAPSGNNRYGRAYLFQGNSKRNMDTDPDITFNCETRNSDYGIQVVFGDIDGDHVNDIVIAACGFGQPTGRAYVYWGNGLAGPDPKPDRILTGENSKDYFGYGLDCGDVNNDGFDDLVIGACGYKAGANQGRAYLYYGGPGGYGPDHLHLSSATIQIMAVTVYLIINVAGQMVGEESNHLFERDELAGEYQVFLLGRCKKRMCFFGKAFEQHFKYRHPHSNFRQVAFVLFGRICRRAHHVAEVIQ